MDKSPISLHRYFSKRTNRANSWAYLVGQKQVMEDKGQKYKRIKRNLSRGLEFFLQTKIEDNRFTNVYQGFFELEYWQHI